MSPLFFASIVHCYFPGYLDLLGETTAGELLETVVRKLLSAKLQTLKIAFLLSFARVTAANADWVFTVLQAMGTVEISSTVVEPKKKRVAGKKGALRRGGKSAGSGGGVKIVVTQVPALSALLNLWFTTAGDLYSQYLCQVTLAALSALLSRPNFAAALAQIPVEGFPVAVGGGGGGSGSGKKPLTRAGAKAEGVTVGACSTVSALHKAVAVVAALTARVVDVKERALQRLRGEKVSGDDEDEDEDLADLAMIHGGSDDSGDDHDGADDGGNDDEEEGGRAARLGKDSKSERRLKRKIEQSLRGYNGDNTFADAGDFDMARFQVRNLVIYL